MTPTADERAALAENARLLGVPVEIVERAHERFPVAAFPGEHGASLRWAFCEGARTPDTGAGDAEVGELIEKHRNTAAAIREILVDDPEAENAYEEDAQFHDATADALARLSRTGSAVTAILQAGAGPVGEAASLVVYQDEKGRLWTRPQDEFDDGRFIELPANPAAPAAPAQDHGGRDAMTETNKRA